MTAGRKSFQKFFSHSIYNSVYIDSELFIKEYFLLCFVMYFISFLFPIERRLSWRTPIYFYGIREK